MEVVRGEVVRGEVVRGEVVRGEDVRGEGYENLKWIIRSLTMIAYEFTFKK